MASFSSSFVFGSSVGTLLGLGFVLSSPSKQNHIRADERRQRQNLEFPLIMSPDIQCIA
jgi:hypothetical protein